MVNTDKKNLMDWVKYYTKVLSDDYYTNCYGQVIYLDDVARNYIRIQMALVDEEIRDEC